MNPLADMLNGQGRIVLDGGLATALEAAGHNLDDPLWSARLLADNPDAIRSVHRAFLEAGADCITTASYQGTVPGFVRAGFSEREAVDLLRRSVELAVSARDAFWSDAANQQRRLRPLVAASVGPYGAFLANGAEYTGDYDLGACGLYAFHRERWQILIDAGADLMACETIPSAHEAAALLRLADETPRAKAWLSFSCRDGQHLNDGTPVARMASGCDTVAGIVAVGINCTAPQHVRSLIESCKTSTSLPIVAYPNSGEEYDAKRGAWHGEGAADWSGHAREWISAGASAVGGCCRVGPDRIREIRRVVFE